MRNFLKRISILILSLLLFASWLPSNLVTVHADENISMKYIPAKEISSVTLGDLRGEGWTWRPTWNEGDCLEITENGEVTKYYFDSAEFRGAESVRGFFDDDGNGLCDRFRCQEIVYGGELYSFRPFFDWVDGFPTTSGQNGMFELLLYEKDSPEGSEPVVRSEPVLIYIEPYGNVDDVQYRVDKDGSAYVYQVFGKRTEYVIQETVKLDDGREYPVNHIGRSDIYGGFLDDGGSFMGHKTIESISIPKTITTVKSYAFMGIPLVKKVTIPSTVEKIGDYAFGYDGEYDLFGGIKNLKKMPDFIIYAKAGSEGARYAKENGFTCIDPEEKAKLDAADQAYAKAKNTPAKGTITNVKRGVHSLTVKWKKLSKATGYKVRYSTDKNFKKGVKTRTVKTYSKKGLTIKKLKNRKWYVQVRAYRTVGGKTYYGAWSARRSVTVK